MNELLALLTPPVIMAIVAAILAMAAVYVLSRPSQTEGAVYFRRIVGTMLTAGAIILGSFAWMLESGGLSA